MLQVFVGDNSMGKTKELRRLLSLVPDGQYVTNLFGLTYDKLGYDMQAVDYVCDELGCEPHFVKGDIILFGDEHSRQANYIFTLLCTKVNNIFLDEPEHGLTREETNRVLAAINSILCLHKNIVISTHAWALTTIGDAKLVFFSQGSKRDIDRGELFEKMDTVRG